jgi:3'(2'), 5'-bisphosphate nucleotidase
MNKAKVCTVIRKLAIEAGREIMEIYDNNNIEVKFKNDESPVTHADEVADRLIFFGLREAFPNIPIVTEEQAETHNEQANTFFIVDPLDGTKEFIHRRGEFTVNIAYVVDGQPLFGVVYAPAKGRLFYTDGEGRSIEELGTHNINQIGDIKYISVSAPSVDGLIVVASKSHRDQALEDYIAKYTVLDSRAAGSSLKFCLIATGEADFYPRVGRTMEWDTAAGHAILNGAGGHVVRFDNHEPLIYGKPLFENPFFIASVPGVYLQKA